MTGGADSRAFCSQGLAPIMPQAAWRTCAPPSYFRGNLRKSPRSLLVLYCSPANRNTDTQSRKSPNGVSLTFAVSHRVSESRTDAAPSPLFSVLFPTRSLRPGSCRTPPPSPAAPPRDPAGERDRLPEEWRGSHHGDNAVLSRRHSHHTRTGSAADTDTPTGSVCDTLLTPSCSRGRTPPMPPAAGRRPPQGPLSYCALAHSSCTPRR